MTKATDVIRRMTKIVKHMYPDAIDPSVIVQRRAKGVRVMLVTQFIDGKIVGSFGTETANTVEEAAANLCDRLVDRAKIQAFAIENAIHLPEQAE